MKKNISIIILTGLCISGRAIAFTHTINNYVPHEVTVKIHFRKGGVLDLITGPKKVVLPPGDPMKATTKTVDVDKRSTKSFSFVKSTGVDAGKPVIIEVSGNGRKNFTVSIYKKEGHLAPKIN